MPGTIVGKISLKVVPDTTQFRRDLRKAANRAEDSVVVKIPAELDMRHLRLSVLKAIRDMQKLANDHKIKFKVDIDTKGVRGEAKRATDDIQDTIDAVKPKIDVDTEVNKNALRRAKDKLKDWLDKINPLKARVVTDVIKPFLKAAAARLAFLARPRSVPFLPKIDRASYAKVASSLATLAATLAGGRVVKDLLKGFKDFGKELDRSVPKIAAVSGAIANIGSGALAGVSNIAAVTLELAQLGGLALALPGTLAGLAIGVGISFAAFKDLDDVLPSVKKSLSALQNTISKSFWDEAKKPIQQFTRDTFPVLSKAVKSTAGDLGKFFSDLALALGKGVVPALPGMFKSLDESIRIAAGGTKFFASIVRQLGEVGASQLPRLAQWYVEIQKNADAWLKSKGPKGLTKELNLAIEVAKGIGTVFLEIAGIIADIGLAAANAGGGSISTLAIALDNIGKITSGPAFQKGLTTVFEAAHKAIKAIVDGSGPEISAFLTTLSTTFSKILPSAGRALGSLLGGIANALNQVAVQDAIVKLFDAIERSVEALKPALGPLGLAFAALIDVVAILAPPFAALVTAVLTPLSKLFVALAPSIAVVAAALSEVLLVAVEAVTPYIDDLTAWITENAPVNADALAGTIREFAGWLRDNLPGIIATAVAVIKTIWQVIAVLIQKIADLVQWFNNSKPAIIAFISTALGAILPLVGLGVAFYNVGKKIVDWTQDLFDTKKGGDSFTANAASMGLGILQFGAKLFTGQLNIGSYAGSVFRQGGSIRNSWNSMLKSCRDALSSIGNAISSSVSTVSRVWSAGWNTIKTTLSNIWNQIKSGVSSSITTLTNTMRTIPGKAVSAIGDLGSTLYNAGAKLIGGLINGITSKIQDLRNTMSGVAGSVKGFFPGSPVKEGPLTSWNGGGAGKRLISQGLIAGFKSSTRDLSKAMTDLTIPITGAVSYAGPAASAAAPLRSTSNDNSRTINLTYNAAPGSSLGAEGDLFDAIRRAGRL